MNTELIFLGGTEEIGANSSYYYIDGTGIVIDAGLHPKHRDKRALPLYETIKDKPLDLLIITHAHIDHIGAIPYLLKYHPHVKIWMTEATRSLAEIMLKDTAKILKSEVAEEYSEEMLSLYKPEILEKINMVMEAKKFNYKYDFRGRAGRSKLQISFYPAGHILGAASILIESGGKAMLHTGDINLDSQAVLSAAAPPKHHIDTIITESTNAGAELPDYQSEKMRLAKFINGIVDINGSVLIPVFALGKTQEMLRIIYGLMRKTSIPVLPVYTAGLGFKISKVYDKFCYYPGMKEPGFEISDIPQQRIEYDRLRNGKFFKEPSIVLAASGMLNNHTLSLRLAKHWMKLRNFGIAFTGYQDELSPGYALMNSNEDEYFSLAGKKVKCICRIGKFRFSSHSGVEGLMNYVENVKPLKLYIVHGDTDSCEKLAQKVQDILPASKIFIPGTGKTYDIF